MGKQHKLDSEKRVMSEEESSDEKERKGGSLSRCAVSHSVCGYMSVAGMTVQNACSPQAVLNTSHFVRFIQDG